MISLGDDWMLKGTEIFHACGPELVHRWTGGCVCECGSPIPQRVEAFHRWICEQRSRSRTSDGQDGPVDRQLLRFNWHS